MTTLVTSAISYLNTHKASIKSYSYMAQHALGAIALYHCIKKKIYSREGDDTVGIPGRLSYALAQISFICTAATTPWAVHKITFMTQKLFTAEQLLKWCGPYATFEGNWKNPSDIVSLVGAAFTIPAALRCLFCKVPQNRVHEGIQWAAFGSLIISRPFLHQANQLAQFVLSKIS
jgi:hypothetical protein